MEDLGTIEVQIARELSLAIERRGLTRVAAARTLGTSVKHLSAVLTLKARASMPTLMRWSDRLGIQWVIEAHDLFSK